MAENHHEFTSYNYVLGNPITYADFMGLDTIRIDDNKTTPKAGDDIQGNDGSFNKPTGDAAVVNSTRGLSASMNSGPDIEPVNGFWGNVGAYALGRNHNGSAMTLMANRLVGHHLWDYPLVSR